MYLQTVCAILNRNVCAKHNRIMKKTINDAADLMLAGRMTESKALIHELLDTASENSALYSDAVNIFMDGYMYEDAKAVFTLYRQRFHKDLDADFDVSDIVKAQAARNADALEIDHATIKIFKRMSAYERGKFSNRPSLIPLKEVRISDDEIVLLKGSREYRYSWSQVLEASLVIREGFRGGVFNEPLVRTLHLRTPDRTFRFDVSSRFPDFRNSDLLMSELKKHITIIEKRGSYWKIEF